MVERTPQQTVIYEALRFANWAAGQGICPVEGEDAAGPEDFLMAYSDATGDDDWETLPARIAALAAREPSIADDFVEALAESYTFYVDDGRTHTPEPHEREMLVDFGHNLIAEYEAHLDAGRAPAARSGGLEPLDEADYEDIVNAATIQMRKAKFGARGQMITVQDGLDWWIMKETESRILAALEAADPAPAVKPLAWLHEIKEPDGESSILSRSPENPFSHWLEKYREQCTYSAAPLYTRPSHPEARRPTEQSVTRAMITRASAEYQALFGKYLLSSHARRILKAAMEAGRADQ